jgi:raffinose/stachyose/melibiose transport system substrate-binding protein
MPAGNPQTNDAGSQNEKEEEQEVKHRSNIMQAAAGALVLLAATAGAGSSLAQETVTLRVWDTFSDANQDEGMNALIAAFEAAHPNIKIQRDVQTSDDMRPIIQTALASGTGPDVFYFDTGPGFAGVLARAGLLLPLDDAYASGDWDHIHPWTRERTTFGDHTYGIANEIEFYGAYYNKDLFSELGLDVPQDYEQFLAVAQALKDAGRIPVAFADQGGWPAFHLFSVWANNYAGKQKMERLLFDDGSWTDPDIVAAIQSFFVDMNQAGYLIPNTTAVSYDDAINLYAAGQAGMHISGSWALNSIIERQPPFETGWFFVPAPGGGAVPPAGLGSGYFISAASKHPEEAKAFLDFLFEPANARIWVETMLMIPPYDVDTSSYDLPELFRTVVEAASDMEMGFNIDVLTPDRFNTVMADGFQAVLLGSKTPEQQAADLQAAIEAFRNAQ